MAFNSAACKVLGARVGGVRSVRIEEMVEDKEMEGKGRKKDGKGKGKGKKRAFVNVA